uniref:Uncharacterized protein n=1 Tax=Anguilla anguilla TaxID=7936 RepID=A0A0E9Q9U4_ANGAN
MLRGGCTITLSFCLFLLLVHLKTRYWLDKL